MFPSWVYTDKTRRSSVALALLLCIFILASLPRCGKLWIFFIRVSYCVSALGGFSQQIVINTNLRWNESLWVWHIEITCRHKNKRNGCGRIYYSCQSLCVFVLHVISSFLPAETAAACCTDLQKQVCVCVCVCADYMEIGCVFKLPLTQ